MGIPRYGLNIDEHKGKSYILVTADITLGDITLTHILSCETTVDMMATGFVGCSDITMTSQ